MNLLSSSSGRTADYNITDCGTSLTDTEPNECTRVWKDLPGMDRTASAIVFIFNFKQYGKGEREREELNAVQKGV